jgi:hypothetical protein
MAERPSVSFSDISHFNMRTQFASAASHQGAERESGNAKMVFRVELRSGLQEGGG